MTGSLHASPRLWAASTQVCFRVTFADGSILPEPDGGAGRALPLQDARPPVEHDPVRPHRSARIVLRPDARDRRRFRTRLRRRLRESASTTRRARWCGCATSGTSSASAIARIEQAKANARFHYALGADFYGYWLDLPLMMYTCAYWKEGTRSVEEAQRNKIDHVCRKIRLKPGESVVDIGCGFGGFMFRALGELRRARVRRQHHHRASRLAARADRQPRSAATSSRCAKPISARCTPSSTRSSRSACSSTPVATSCAKW